MTIISPLPNAILRTTYCFTLNHVQNCYEAVCTQNVLMNSAERRITKIRPPWNTKEAQGTYNLTLRLINLLCIEQLLTCDLMNCLLRKDLAAHVEISGL